MPSVVENQRSPGQARLRRDVAALVAELSGYELEDLDPACTFFELGFDSLFLAQLSAALHQRYAVSVTFRQLFDELPTIAALAVHLQKTLPEHSVAASPGESPADGWTPADALEPAAAGLSRIVAAQMKLMAEQLRVLERAGHLAPDGHGSLEATRRLIEQYREEVVATQTRPENATFPLTDSQREVWIACQVSRQVHTAYNESETLILEGSLDVPAFRRAVEATLSRHQALHLRFAGDGSRQWIDDQSRRAPSVGFEDLSGLAPDERERRLRDKVARRATERFDLESGPAYHADIVRLGESLHHFIFFAHHLVYDGWSARVLIGDISACYAAYLRAEQPELQMPARYDDFVAACLRARATDEYRRDLEYWQRKVRQAPALELPTDFRREPVRRGQGATVKHRFGDEFYRAVNDAARTMNTSKFNLLITLFAALLRRLSGQGDLTIGVSVAAQATLGFPTLIGHCVNLLPLRLAIDDASFESLFGSVRAEFLELYDHNRCTLHPVVEELDLRRDASRTPVVEAIFNFSQYNADLDLPGLQSLVIENPKYSAHCDLFAKIREDDGFMTADWDYNASLFSAETVSHWLRCLEALSIAALGSPTSGVLTTPMLDEADQGRVLEEWNRTRTPLPAAESVHGLIGKVVADNAAATAVSCESRSLTYRQVWEQSGHIAASLQAKGVGPRALVGVCLDRGIDLIPTLLGVWRAGCAYLPLEPSLPSERLEFMLADSACSALITSRESEGNLSRLPGPSLRLEDVSSRFGSAACTFDEIPEAADALAYVIYTSGSTGKPKGVGITQGNVVNLLSSMREEPGFSEEDVLLAVTTAAFDISVLELFLPLTVGGRVEVASLSRVGDGVLLGDLLESCGATVMQATPSTWQLLIESGWSGNSTLRALCGGESLTPKLAADLLSRAGAVWNMYGPTETTIWSTIWEVAPGAEISIGHPIANTSVFVLDESRLPVPLGVRGEIHIGGAGVSPGYLNRAELTEDRFIDLSLPSGDEVRVYATGDLGYWRHDGSLMYVGRADTQVKVRGHRIELGEIETVLSEHPLVSESAVIVDTSVRGDAEIIGYVSASVGLTRAAVVDHLRGFLPEYMLPQRLMSLDELPKTPNNKIDRAALRALASEPLDHAAFEIEHGRMGPSDRSYRRSPPRDRADGRRYRPNGRLESSLLTLWREELGRDDIGVGDDFVELGGHSLVAARIVGRLRELIDASIYIVAIYDAGTVERLAEYLIEHYGSAVYRAFPELSPEEPVPTTSEASDARPKTIDDRAVRQFRRLVPSIPIDHRQAKRPNGPAVFLLSAPRSGSTLARVMMAGNPRLFSPPELYLMGFNTMRERHEYVRDHWNEAELQGLIRALMELRSWDPAAAEDYVAARVEEDTTISEFCAALQRMVKPRLLVDKTPDYAYDPNSLMRIESWFTDPLYVHLVRHPLGMMNSFHKLRLDRFSPYRDRFTAAQIAELNWLVANDNITAFFAGIPAERQHFLRFEDLLAQPEQESRRLCRFLGVPFDAEMLNPYGSGRARMSDGINEWSVAIGDPRFHQHEAIDASVADSWKAESAGVRVSLRTRELARSYGYLVDEDEIPEPIRFGPRDELSGVYHSPSSDGDKPAVVICPPILLESSRTHRCLRRLADDLASNGYPVVRFDYAGTGDSIGDLQDVVVADWLSNVSAAIDEAERRSGARRACIVGVRLGALLGALAVDGRQDIAGVVLWDAVAAGRRFLGELAIVQEELIRADPRFVDETADLVDDDELVGYSVPGTLREGIASLEIRAFGGAGAPRCRVAVVASKSGPDADEVAGHLESIGTERSFTTVDYDCRWTSFTGTVLFPHEILGAITRQMDKLVQHGKTVPIRKKQDSHRSAVHS